MPSDGELSQDQIDALMSGTSPFDLGEDTEEDEKDSSSEDKTDFASVLNGEPEKKEKPAKKPARPISSSGDNGDNLELLLDVSMTLTVELGRARRSVKDVLSYGEGSIVELEKLSGETVDILVNGRLIARGEVVVIDETYGVKIVEIVDPYDRFRALV